jgi:fatty acid desaturase
MTSPAVLSEPSAPSSLPGSPRLGGVVAATGETWTAFRLTLEPRWAVVRRDLACCYACIAGGLLAHAAVALAAGNWVGLALAPLAGAWIGYWVQSLSCFLHEAAHFNVHPDKLRNDRLANRLLCPLVGEEIAHYRAVHWQHHLHLGDPADTEVSYHHAPTPRFLIESLTGLHVLRVLRTRQRAVGGVAAGRVGAWPLLRAALLHGSVVLAALLAGLPSTALAWCIGVGMVYPFCNTMRQLLEHRALDAPLDADFTRVAHGAVNRLFGSDPVSRSFGAAGFNRHLLHHWHPAASYTRFDDLEAFLLQTPLRPALDAARTSYWATWRALARAARDARPA